MSQISISLVVLSQALGAVAMFAGGAVSGLMLVSECSSKRVRLLGTVLGVAVAGLGTHFAFRWF